MAIRMGKHVYSYYLCDLLGLINILVFILIICRDFVNQDMAYFFLGGGVVVTAMILWWVIIMFASSFVDKIIYIDSELNSTYTESGKMRWPHLCTQKGVVAGFGRGLMLP